MMMSLFGRSRLPEYVIGEKMSGHEAETATWPDLVNKKFFYWQLYMMPSAPLIAVPGTQPMPLRAA